MDSKFRRWIANIVHPMCVMRTIFCLYMSLIDFLYENMEISKS